MGYRSDVAYAIVCTSEEDRNKIIGQIAPEQWELIKGEVTLKEDRILYHDPSVKWYSSEIFGATFGGGTGFVHIDAHRALIQAAELAAGDYYATEGEEGVLNMGVFMRLGEDSDDFEKDTWGLDELPEGYPEWYELVDERRELVVGWENPS